MLGLSLLFGFFREYILPIMEFVFIINALVFFSRFRHKD